MLPLQNRADGLRIELTKSMPPATRTILSSLTKVSRLLTGAGQFWIPSGRLILLILGAIALIPRTAPASDDTSLFHNVFVTTDTSTVQSLFQNLKAPRQMSFLELAGYDYAVSPGYIIDDSGFIPQVHTADPLPRKIIYGVDGLTSSRSITTHEILQIHHIARTAIHRGYKNNIQNQMIKTVQDVEDELPIQKSSFGIVKDLRIGKIVGTLRAYQGFVSPQKKIILPSFEIMRKRNLLSNKDEAEILELAGPTYGSETTRAIVEIGQFFIEASLAPEERLEVRRQLLSWLNATVLEKGLYEKIIVAHVSKNILARKYQQEYGFDRMLIEKSFQENQETITEKILIVKSNQLKLKLAKIIQPHKFMKCQELFVQ